MRSPIVGVGPLALQRGGADPPQWPHGRAIARSRGQRWPAAALRRRRAAFLVHGKVLGSPLGREARAQLKLNPKHRRQRNRVSCFLRERDLGTAAAHLYSLLGQVARFSLRAREVLGAFLGAALSLWRCSDRAVAGWRPTVGVWTPEAQCVRQSSAVVLWCCSVAGPTPVAPQAPHFAKPRSAAARGGVAPAQRRIPFPC